jgi:hypothetical protein
VAVATTRQSNREPRRRPVLLNSFAAGTASARPNGTIRDWSLRATDIEWLIGALRNSVHAIALGPELEACLRILLVMASGVAAFQVEFPGALAYLPGMSQTLEQRVEELEKKVAELSSNPSLSVLKKDPWRTYGAFKDDPDFEEAVRLGREYREQQTYEKEIAGS